jgi:hypothetical protein
MRCVTNTVLTFLLYYNPFSDDTIFRHIAVSMDSLGNINSSDCDLHKLKRHAIMLTSGEDPSGTTQVDVDPYKITFFYIDLDEDKAMIASNFELTQAGRQFHEKGNVKIFASVKIEKDEEESSTLEWVDESSTQTAHTTPGTHEMLTYIVKLALVGSGGKKGNNFKPTCVFVFAPATGFSYFVSTPDPMNSQLVLLYIYFPDDVVFRRIKYATNPGRFESMKKRAIWLFLGEEDAQVDVALYKVTFFYTDPHGDKVSIESDSDIFTAANRFTKGGLKVFANVQRMQEKDMAEVKNLADLINEGIHRFFEDAEKAAENKRQQHQAEFIRRYVENANKAKEKKQAATRRCLEDANKAEEQKLADTVTQTLEIVVHKKEEKTAQSETFEESESTDGTTSEEEQAGSSDEEKNDDKTADSTHSLAALREYQTFYSKASPVKHPLPKEVDIVSKGTVEPSFSSDAEGSGEIAAVLGETLDRAAQVIDDMHLEFDRTASTEEIEKEIVVEDAKEVQDESWREELDSNMSESEEDGKDDYSHDSWNVGDY